VGFRPPCPSPPLLVAGLTWAKYYVEDDDSAVRILGDGCDRASIFTYLISLRWKP